MQTDRSTLRARRACTPSRCASQSGCGSRRVPTATCSSSARPCSRHVVPPRWGTWHGVRGAGAAACLACRTLHAYRHAADIRPDRLNRHRRARVQHRHWQNTQARRPAKHAVREALHAQGAYGHAVQRSPSRMAELIPARTHALLRYLSRSCRLLRSNRRRWSSRASRWCRTTARAWSCEELPPRASRNAPSSQRPEPP